MSLVNLLYFCLIFALLQFKLPCSRRTFAFLSSSEQHPSNRKERSHSGTLGNNQEIEDGFSSGKLTKKQVIPVHGAGWVCLQGVTKQQREILTSEGGELPGWAGN